MENKRSDSLYSDKDEEENEDKNGVIIPKSDFPIIDDRESYVPEEEKQKLNEAENQDNNINNENN